MNYVVVPGLMGTVLTADRYAFNQPVWLNYLVLAADGFPLLKLNAAGDGPAPGLLLKRWIIGKPIAQYYAALINQIVGLGPTLTFSYDWRLSIRTTAAQLASAITARFGSDPVKIVAHSLGGLVARGAWRLLAEAGHGDQVEQLVTLGCPHYGCLSTLTGFARFAPTYYRVLALVSLLRGFSPFRAAAVLDPVMATFPSVYELLPFAGVGPLSSNPALAAQLYQASTYNLFNSYVSQTRLTAALATQAWLATAGVPARTVAVQGTGLGTPATVKSAALVGLPIGYGYSLEGDGTVARPYGDLIGASNVYFPGAEHSAIGNNPAVLAELPTILGA